MASGVRGWVRALAKLVRQWLAAQSQLAGFALALPHFLSSQHCSRPFRSRESRHQRRGIVCRDSLFLHLSFHPLYNPIFFLHDQQEALYRPTINHKHRKKYTAKVRVTCCTSECRCLVTDSHQMSCHEYVAFQYFSFLLICNNSLA